MVVECVCWRDISVFLDKFDRDIKEKTKKKKTKYCPSDYCIPIKSILYIVVDINIVIFSCWGWQGSKLFLLDDWHNVIIIVFITGMVNQW